MSTGDLILIVVASLAGSFVKSVTGMGYPLLAVPFLSMFIGVQDAVTIVAFPNAVVNLLLNVDSRAARHDTRDLPVLAITMTIGAVAGTLLLVHVPEDPLMLALAATIVVFVIQYFREPNRTIAPATSRRWSAPVGVVAGVMQGATGVSGPIVAMWLHGYRLAKDSYVFSVTLLFFVGGASQFVVLALAGEFDQDRIVASLAAFIAALSMIPIGTRLRGKLAGHVFERLIITLLIVSAFSLLLRTAT